MKGDSISAVKLILFISLVLDSTESLEILTLYKVIIPLLTSGSSHDIVIDCGPFTVAVRFLGTPGTAR